MGSSGVLSCVIKYFLVVVCCSFVLTTGVISKPGGPPEIRSVLRKSSQSKEEAIQDGPVCACASQLVHMQHELYVKYLTGTQLIQHMYTCKEYVYGTYAELYLESRISYSSGQHGLNIRKRQHLS